MKLTAVKVMALVKAGERGRWGDGGGLWLQVDGKRASWLFRYTLAGKQRAMGLGTVDQLGLKEARDAAAQHRAALLTGRDPLMVREEERKRAAEAATAVAASLVITFKAAAEAWVAEHEKGWRNSKHAAQVTSSLSAYAYPLIGKKPVSDIDTGDLLAVLRPIWNTKPETASRVRQRIEATLAYALARGWRKTPNAASWRGHLAALLPSPGKLRRTRHHPALAWQDMPRFMARLRAMPGDAARALEFATLCASRSGEVRGMTWREVDLNGKVWTVPAGRIKAGREHRVPLSDAALALLQGQLAKTTADQHSDAPNPGSLVWPGTRRGMPMSDMTLAAVIKRMNELDTPTGTAVVSWADRHGEAVVPHGFRSTFRDWCADHGHDGDLAEAALAHAKGDQTARAYQRSDLFTRRSSLMAAWAVYATGGSVRPVIANAA